MKKYLERAWQRFITLLYLILSDNKPPRGG
jgi:hypothetical protein